MQNSILEKIGKSFEAKRPNFLVGDRVVVSVRLKEGDKERIQVFRGIVISKQPKSGKGSNAMFTVRKISEGIGVERIFPLHSPFIEKIEVETSSEVRKSRLYYLRHLKGKKARLKEAERFGELVVAAEPPPPAETLSTASNASTVTSPAPATAPVKTEKKDKK